MTEVRIGKVEHYFPRAQAAVVHVDRGEFRLGDTLHIVGHGDDVFERIESLQLDHRPIRAAHEGETVGVQVRQRVHEKDEVFLVHDEDAERIGWDPAY